MKKIMILMFVIWFALFTQISLAEDTNEEDTSLYLAEILRIFEDTHREIFESVEAIDEEDYFVSNVILKQMQMDTYILMDAVEDDEYPEDIELVGDMIETKAKHWMNNNYNHLETAWILLEDAEVYTTCSAVWTDSYMMFTDNVYDLDGSYIATQVLEFAEREDGQKLLLLMDYNERLGTTGRFMLKVDEMGSISFYTETMGMTLDVVLDVKEWQLGVDPENWSKELLYPASYLY